MNMSVSVCLGDQTATAATTTAKQDIISYFIFYIKCIKIKSKPKTKQKYKCNYIEQTESRQTSETAEEMKWS